MADSRTWIVGIGDDGLDGLAQSVRENVERADLLLGDEKTLQFVEDLPAEKVRVGGDVADAVAKIEKAKAKRIVVLVYGDPLFYGWARFLCDRLGKDSFEVVPHVSSMQLAFARVRESWDEAYLTNLANHALSDVVERIRIAERVGLFTTDTCGPADVAKALLDRGIRYFVCYVCENLGSPDERVTRGSLSEIADQQFGLLNVLILIREEEVPDQPREASNLRFFGNPDENFIQSRPKQGLLTPAEVRAVALAQLSIHPQSTVWDIGAGSGSVGVEAARLAAQGNVYSIEMDPGDYALIEQNAERFGVTNLHPVLGQAPDAWSDLPDPDCIFIEGAGGEAHHIAVAAFERLRPGGRLVANLGSVENLAALHGSLSETAAQVQTWMMNIARGNEQLGRVRFDALNPTFLLAAERSAR